MLLGGRAGELVVLGQGSTGAANDLAKATELATKMVREFGLSPSRSDRWATRRAARSSSGGGGSEFSSRPFAEETQATIDAEVARLLREAEQRAVEILKAHRDVLDRLVDLLVAKETVDGSAVYDLAGRDEPADRPGRSRTVAPGRGAPTSAPAAAVGSS